MNTYVFQLTKTIFLPYIYDKTILSENIQKKMTSFVGHVAKNVDQSNVTWTILGFRPKLILGFRPKLILGFRPKLILGWPKLILGWPKLGWCFANQNEARLMTELRLGRGFPRPGRSTASVRYLISARTSISSARTRISSARTKHGFGQIPDLGCNKVFCTNYIGKHPFSCHRQNPYALL